MQTLLPEEKPGDVVLLTTGFSIVSYLHTPTFLISKAKSAEVVFDVTGEITSGRSFGFLDAGRDINRLLEAVAVEFRYNALVSSTLPSPLPNAC